MSQTIDSKTIFFSLIVNSTKTTFFFSILDLSAPAVHIWKLQYFIRVYRKLVSKTRLYIIETSKMLYWWSYWWSSLVRMSESRFLKRRYAENQIPSLVLFLVSKITAEALWFLKVQQAILTFGPFGVLIILWNLFNFFLIFAEIRFRQKSWYSVNFV